MEKQLNNSVLYFSEETFDFTLTISGKEPIIPEKYDAVWSRLSDELSFDEKINIASNIKVKYSNSSMQAIILVKHLFNFSLANALRVYKELSV